MLIRRAYVLLLLLVEGVIGSLTNNPLASFSSKDLQIRDLESETMPSLFGPEEAQFDRYAACLAATEGLRRIRDKKLGGRRFLRVTDEPTEAQKRITSEYVVNSSKVLEAMGMSVSQFNQLGRQVGANSELKEKVSTNNEPLTLTCLSIFVVHSLLYLFFLRSWNKPTFTEWRGLSIWIVCHW